MPWRAYFKRASVRFMQTDVELALTRGPHPAWSSGAPVRQADDGADADADGAAGAAKGRTNAIELQGLATAPTSAA